ncbi:recombinase family protein [Vibrio alginolyticus]
MFRPSPNPEVYSYRRFSNIEQEKGTSLARQDKYAYEIAEKYGLTVNEDLILTDKGLSAFHAEHKTKGAFGVFLSLVKSNHIKPGSFLIIESLDRMSREQVIQAQSTLNELVMAGITVITARGDKVFNRKTFSADPVGTMLYAIIEMQRSHEESLRKQGFSIDFIHEQVANFRKGEIADVSGSLPFWLSRKPKSHPKEKAGFELNEHQSTALLIVELYLKENMGLNSISRELGTRGIKSPTGRDVWGVSTITSILANPSLCGRKVFEIKYLKEGETVKEKFELDNYYPQLISEEEFETIQAVKKRKHQAMSGDKSVSQKNAIVYLLTDYGKKSICAKCGKSIGSQPQRQKYRIRRRLHCSTQKETKTCCKSIIQDYLEDAFLMSVSRHIDYDLINQDVDSNTKLTIDEKIKEIDQKMDNILDTLTIISDGEKRASEKAKYQVLQNKKEELKKQSSEYETYTISADSIKEFISKVQAARNYRNREARLLVKDVLVKAIKKLSVHMEPKPLSYYGYGNIHGNALVNVIDVEFYSSRNLSIFVTSEKDAGELLFTRIDDDFANDARGSYTEEQLAYWNQHGFEALLEKLAMDDSKSDSSAPDNVWLGYDIASALSQVVVDELVEEQII